MDLSELLAVVCLLSIMIVAQISSGSEQQSDLLSKNIIPGVEQDQSQSQAAANQVDYRRVACGSTATNLTHVIVKNPQHPEATYKKTICEAIIERVDPSINELTVNFKQLELYRPTYEGTCLHDRFAIYTDLNAIVGPVLCGNQTGRTISIPFIKQHSNLIVSVMTSDLDHDRTWHIEIEQRR